MKYANKILNDLVDKYERSVLYNGLSRVSRSISIILDEKYCKDYFDRYLDVKVNFDNECIEICDKGFISVDYSGVHIKRIYLNIDMDDKIYLYLDRIPLRNIYKKILSILDNYHGIYLDNYKEHLIALINNNKSIKKYINKDKLDVFEDELIILSRIDSIIEPVSLRRLSIELYNNSKTLEKLLSKVINIIKEFFNDVFIKDLSSVEILAYLNIYKSEKYLFIKGNGFLIFDNYEIDLSKMDGSVGISYSSFKNLKEVVGVEKCITIENKTSFDLFKSEEYLVMYTAGFTGYMENKFISIIDKEVKVYHFGDIDYGGFNIFVNFVKKTNKDILPFHMDKDTLIKYEKFTSKISSNSYINKLKRLLSINDYSVFHDCINYMIEHKVRLEQEIIDV